MTYTATMTQTPVKGGRIIRFEIGGHPESPVLECKTSDFSSGKDILERFEKWSKQYGNVRLEK